MSLIFVDCEAMPRGDSGSTLSPYNGILTEFGAVSEDEIGDIFVAFALWLKLESKGQPVFISDNPAWDYQWIVYYCDKYLGRNPFGHSARRIGDFYAGLTGNFKNSTEWKKFRQTKHDHNPVNDATGNLEAFKTIEFLFLGKE